MPATIGVVASSIVPPVQLLMSHHKDWPAWGSSDVYGTARGEVFSSGLMGDVYSYDNNGGAVGGSLSYQFDVAAGTYTLTIIHPTDINVGIATVTIDGVSVGTYDGFSASLVPNLVTAIAGIALSAGGHVVKLQTLAKNPGASSHYLNPQWFALDRTGA